MPASTTILYPAEEGAKFDMDYLLNTHMPLVMKHWERYGLKGYEVTQFDAIGGQKSQYIAQCILKWDKPESVEKATQGPKAKDVFGDVPNFTSVQGLFMTGEVKGSK